MTLDEADLYVATVMDPAPWDLSTDDLRTRALTSAQRIIEALNTNNITDEYGEYVQEIKDAQVEIALKLLDGVDPEIEAYNSSVKSFGFDQLKQTNKSGETPLHIIAGVPSITAFNILRRYMPDITTVRLNRTD